MRANRAKKIDRLICKSCPRFETQELYVIYKIACLKISFEALVVLQGRSILFSAVYQQFFHQSFYPLYL